MNRIKIYFNLVVCYFFGNTNNKLKKINKEVEEQFTLDQYKATLEMVKKCELGIKFLSTKEAEELSGADKAKEGLLSYENTLRIKRSELEFLEKQFN